IRAVAGGEVTSTMHLPVGVSHEPSGILLPPPASASLMSMPRTCSIAKNAISSSRLVFAPALLLIFKLHSYYSGDRVQIAREGSRGGSSEAHGHQLLALARRCPRSLPEARRSVVLSDVAESLLEDVVVADLKLDVEGFS